MDNRRYALIAEGTVKNIFASDNYELANYIARENYGAEAIAVDVQLIPCNIGDTYQDGIFYGQETGEPIDRTPSEAEQIAVLVEQLEQLKSVLAAAQIMPVVN